LLDASFQLKYASYLVVIALVLTSALGAILWLTSQRLLTASTELVDRGRAVVQEGKKVSKVVEMNIVKDPVYGQDAELLQAFKEGDAQYTQKLEVEQQQLERESQALVQQHRTAAAILAVTLLVFVFVVGVAGIWVTHKVAGPVYKMKRQLSDVASGRLQMPGKLRKGDELVEFFAAFEHMVRSLRERQESEISLLDAAIERLKLSASPEQLEPLVRLREQMRTQID
jgi:nitrogen fixation/metabolism regulation signal transduction histidine kinase